MWSLVYTCNFCCDFLSAIFSFWWIWKSKPETNVHVKKLILIVYTCTHNICYLFPSFRISDRQNRIENSAPKIARVNGPLRHALTSLINHKITRRSCKQLTVDALNCDGVVRRSLAVEKHILEFKFRALHHWWSIPGKITNRATFAW